MADSFAGDDPILGIAIEVNDWLNLLGVLDRFQDQRNRGRTVYSALLCPTKHLLFADDLARVENARTIIRRRPMCAFIHCR